MYSLGLVEDEIIVGMDGDLVLTIVGVTFLFAIARDNGTVDLIVATAVKGVGGRVVLIPWVMFAVTGVLTAIGAVSPAACAIIGPIALGFAGRYGISPLMMGMMVVHGAQAGGFSPISIYGTITNSVMASAGLPNSELTIFFASLVVNTILAAILFFILGGPSLASMRVDPEPEPEDERRGSAAAGRRPPRRGRPSRRPGSRWVPVKTQQIITLLVFVAVAVIALYFEKDIGLVTITAAVVLLLIAPERSAGAVKNIAWPTVLLVAGVSCYAFILTEAGSPEFVGNWAAGLGVAALGALVLCYVGGVVSAFASSTALLPVIIPIAVPLINDGGVSAGLVVAAVAVSSTIVDVSPFSTNGAIDAGQPARHHLRAGLLQADPHLRRPRHRGRAAAGLGGAGAARLVRLQPGRSGRLGPAP